MRIAYKKCWKCGKEMKVNGNITKIRWVCYDCQSPYFKCKVCGYEQKLQFQISEYSDTNYALVGNFHIYNDKISCPDCGVLFWNSKFDKWIIKKDR